MATVDPLAMLAIGAKLVRRALNPTHTQDASMVVLSIRLLFRAAVPIVHFSLEDIGGMEMVDNTTPSNNSFSVPWEVPYSALFGSDDMFLETPTSLAEDLKYRLQQLVLSKGQPLWLRLVRPYGWLGTAPWERLFSAALNRPVLRLPDSPSRPSERADVHFSALFVDPGQHALKEDVLRTVDAIVQAIVRGSSRGKTQVHIFSSARWIPVLKGLENSLQVLVHDPKPDAPTSPQTLPFTASGISPWIEWVIGTMEGQSLDALHFFVRATRDETSARMIVTSDPGGTMEYAADVEIDASELDILMSRAGSWAATFIPALPRYWFALSAFADGLARVRPCAVLCQNLTPEAVEGQFFSSYRLLFDEKAQPAPMLTNGFVYCHPSFIADTARLPEPSFSSVLAVNARALTRRAPFRERVLHTVTHALPGINATDLSAPPNWVSSTQRFLESAVLDVVRHTSEDVLLSQSLPRNLPSSVSLDSPSSDAMEGMQMLEEIQGVVDSYLTKAEGR